MPISSAYQANKISDDPMTYRKAASPAAFRKVDNPTDHCHFVPTRPDPGPTGPDAKPIRP